jgi:glyoxalase family protein
MNLTGLHHLTAVSARIRDNYRFYTEVMGLRLVKRSVNQDDVRAYHLFYADAVGSPGTDLTFFDWDMPPESRGTRSIARTGLRIKDGESLAWWHERLRVEGLQVAEPYTLDGRDTLDFEDPEGQRLRLVVDGGRGDDPAPWDEGPVPKAHQIRGLGPVVLSVPDASDTERVLTRVMNLEHDRSYRAKGTVEGAPDAEYRVYRMAGEGPHAELHVAVEPELAPARLGAGGVHHVAFRTPNDEEYQGWIDRLARLRIPNSGPVDRFYFKSLYFREPAGILFEIATDGPGFAVDEEPEELGRSLALPPFLEPQRAKIEDGLEPLD